jgi:hypothetical protein
MKVSLLLLTKEFHLLTLFSLSELGFLQGLCPNYYKGVWLFKTALMGLAVFFSLFSKTTLNKQLLPLSLYIRVATFCSFWNIHIHIHF